MYTTKPLSVLKRQPEVPPPEGRNSGYLVVKDVTEEDELETCCWGTCPVDEEYERVWELPFPQNRVLTVMCRDGFADAVLFVPVPDHYQPLASNRYYAVVAAGKHRGLVRACSRKEDMVKCCFFCCLSIKDAKPRPFDPADVCQQMEIVQLKRGRFTARAVADEGFAPFPYRYSRGWEVYATKHENLDLLGEAAGGLNNDARLDAFPAASTAAVGRWYCPFYLIKEDGVSPRKQMDRSPFYEVTLEQRWEEAPAHAHARDGASGSSSKPGSGEKVFIGGGSVEAARTSLQLGGAYAWFKAVAPASGDQRIGVCTSVWERMRWVVEQRCGERVHEEEADDDDAGKLIVRRFLVKRMDGSIVVAFDFARLGNVTAQ